MIGSAECCLPRIGRTSGYVVMLELMKRLAAKADPPFQVATMNATWSPKGRAPVDLAENG